MARPKRVTGLEPLSYMGVEATTPPQLISIDRDPRVNDSDFVIGSLWVNHLTNYAWILTGLAGGVATWTPIGNVQLIVGANTGQAEAVDDVLKIYGDSVIETTGAGDTITIDLISAADGDIIIGATGLDADWGTVTSSDGTITITGGPNTLDITRTGGGGTTDFITDAGTANSAGSQINILGGTNINTAGAGMTVTVNLDTAIVVDDITVNNLGLGVVESSAGGVFSSSNGTDGQLFIAGTAIAPAWANLTSSSGTVVITEGPNTIDLESISGSLETVITNSTGASPTAYVLVLSDLGKFILFDSAGTVPNFEIVVEIPPNSSVAFPIGTKIKVVKVQSAGSLYFKEGAGVTIKSALISGAAITVIISATALGGQAFLTKTATDEWYITGGDVIGSLNAPPY